MKQRNFNRIELNFGYGQIRRSDFLSTPDGEISFTATICGKRSNKSNKYNYAVALKSFVPLRVTINTRTLMPQLVSAEIPVGVDHHLNLILNWYTRMRRRARRDEESAN